MTTKEAAALYEAQYVAANSGKGNVVYNPSNKPLDELPRIYGFNNGLMSRSHIYENWQAVAMSEDGMKLGTHICSSESYMPGDLGVLEGTASGRHDDYKKYYPDGYVMEFVSYEDVPKHAKLIAALELAKTKPVARKSVCEITFDDGSKTISYDDGSKENIPATTNKI